MYVFTEYIIPLLTVHCVWPILTFNVALVTISTNEHDANLRLVLQ